MPRYARLAVATAVVVGLAVPSFAQNAAPAAADPGAAAIAAATPPAPAPLPQNPAHILKYLSPDDLDPATLLAPPPADGSDQQKAEVAEVLRMQQAASQARRDQAVWDDRHESSELWIPTLGPIGFDLTKLPATAAMLDAVLHERDAAADVVKVYFGRRRPWTFNDDIQVCEAAGKGGSKVRAYPSGHGTLSYAQAVILAHLMPNKGQLVMARAEDFAESRMICGVHSRSDIRASAVLGTTIGMLLLHNAKFRPLLDDARAELAAAGLTR
ncbi:phosphatase PAP2 family protein [Rhizobium mayense]|uniref:Phosphatase PAP2 family protein n=1 Tax=Rhizobium mayense TaxID=1312184 RepID=A0ABT7JZF6_9HYPH|nr:phosphatase PAP2 family protein [Rhizobium mayense]MDL2401297.1 phosphatase PAP2 family protein [Rhizobium mayense]